MSDLDRDLWRRFLAGVKPLRPGRPAPLPPAPPTPSPPPPGPARSEPLPAARPAAPSRPLPPVRIGAAAPGVPKERWRDLTRGKLRPERRLDLHGRRAEDALRAVRAFVLQAQADGIDCVEIVTGRGSPDAPGRIRTELPHWLNEPSLRAAILSATHPRAGLAGENQGSVVLLLRKRRVRP